MFSQYSEEVRKVLINAKKEMKELKHPYVGSEHLFLALLKDEKNDVNKKFKQQGIDYNLFKKELINIIGIGSKESTFFLYTPLLKEIINLATIDSKEKGKDCVDIEDLVIALFDECEGVALRVLINMGVDIDNLYDSIIDSSPKKHKNTKTLINSFGVNLVEKALRDEIDPVVGRDLEVRRTIEILSRRTKNNPLLIGDAGVGKTAIVEELAKQISLEKIPTLKGKQIISVSMSSLVAGTKYRGEFEERIGKIISELEDNQDMILFIDEIHTLVGAGGAEGAIDASNILKPALARGKIKLIGATTKEEYKSFIEKDKALDRRFQIVNIEEPDIDTVKKILFKLRPIYQDFHKVIISDNILDLIITLSNRFIYNRKMPDKVIDVLDEVCSKVSISNYNEIDEVLALKREYNIIKNLKNTAIIRNEFQKANEYRSKEQELENNINLLMLKEKKKIKKVQEKDVIQIIESKSKIPFVNYNKLTYKNFAKNFNSKIVGQEQAIKELYKFTRKINCNYNRKKPYSLLFVGNSGVGKTDLAKIYATCFFGDKSLICLDMSEYQESHSISKIIGSPPGYIGYDDNKNIFEKVKENPFSVLLLDEIDKASPNVCDLFLQILDNGVAKNAKGDEIRFDNVLIIMTSNYFNNINTVGFGLEKAEKVYNNLLNVFSKSFLNRISSIVNFEDLSEEKINIIIKNKFKEIKKNYKKNHINLTMTEESRRQIIEKSKYRDFGARQIDKLLDDFVSNQILEYQHI